MTMRGSDTQAQPINIYMDGERVARIVSKHQDRHMGRPETGTSFPDDTQFLMPPGVAYAVR
jgi:hypothetical protein